mmetsp:Transcript_14785/g.12299  ORF Transcript_14785/g.12299 Transcript_14785/m.12299 type:complete len:80 (-) Transcript_14785:84-323(-)
MYKYAHNKHHAAPQHLGKDVDLQTLPLVAFNKAILNNKLPTLWIKYQSILFAPLSTFIVCFEAYSNQSTVVSLLLITGR